MTLCTSLYHGDGGNNNDLTARKYVIHTTIGVRSFKNE